MQMLLVVLNRVERLDPLLEAFMEQGLGGATILRSTGMVKMLAKNVKNIEDSPLFASLRFLLEDDGERTENHTFFMILQDEKVETAKQTVREVVGDLSQPNSAIMLTLPVLSAEGVGF